MRRLPRSVFVSTFLRSFLIQGSWNYHSMVGTGFGFCMLPGLRHLFADSPEELAASIERHTDHFNAHPYLSSVALGATLRLEAEGESADTIRRFKKAVRGPLGGLGDSLFWASWLPLVSMVAVTVGWLGLIPRWAAVVLFLVLYNSGHVFVRVWGLREGWRQGRKVGNALARLDLGEWSERLQAVASLALGVLAAVLLSGRSGLVEAGVVWGLLGLGAFGVGLGIGHRAWRPAAIAAVALMVAISGWGWIR